MLDGFDGLKTSVVSEIQSLYFLEFSQLVDMFQIAAAAVEVLEVDASFDSSQGCQLWIITDVQIFKFGHHIYYLNTIELALKSLDGLHCIFYFPNFVSLVDFVHLLFEDVKTFREVIEVQ